MKTNTKLLSLESENERLIKQFEARVDTMKQELAQSEEKCQGLDCQIKTLQDSEEGLQSTVRNMQQQLGQLQTELMLTQQVSLLFKFRSD